MKKTLFIILLILVNGNIFSQKDTTSVKVSKYLSVSISLTNGSDFKSDNYPSVEGGVIVDNIGFGLVIGRENFINSFSQSDKLDSYYYELKTFLMINKLSYNGLDPSILLGYGGFFNKSDNFIEYGFGLSKTYKKITYGINCSNWNNINYISPNISYCW